MSLLDHELITARYFFPRRYAPPRPTWVEVDGARLACHSSGDEHPLTVVHFHGNGEVVADYIPEFVDLVDELGADCFLAEYRGYGASTGVPQLGAMLDDVTAIREAVGRPLEELVVFGRSVGSIYALEFAARYPEIAGLVIESGIADPLERILLRCSPEELGVSIEELQEAFGDRLDNTAKIRNRRGPTLIIHARHDSLVDVSHAARLASAQEENAKLVLLPHGDHNSIFMENRSRYTVEFQRFLQKVSGPSPDDTLEGFVVPEPVFDGRDQTLEVPRRGPGDTTPLTVPEALQPGRSGPGETAEFDRPNIDVDIDVDVDD